MKHSAKQLTIRHQNISTNINKKHRDAAMVDANRSKLIRISIRNIGCTGNDGIDIELDNIVCLVGKNNAGKSTILRAYELAKGSVSFDINRDRCQYAPNDQPSEVKLEVHIPAGIGNVDEKWKTETEGLLIVKSRWQWLGPDYQKVRTTWDPTGGEDGQGAGRTTEKLEVLIQCLARAYRDHCG